MSDPIADMLTRIRNAQAVEKWCHDAFFQGQSGYRQGAEG
jgi:ribosomal protein S8